jgi:hypothetical protein
MARMSIDDSVARDPRITLLATKLGWSRRETVGCLVQDVWPICYDQVAHVISPKLVDIAANRVGFAAAMIECELASTDRSGRIRIRGAKDRVKYIKDKQDAGREGGLKSGESRAKRRKQNAKQREAAGNPPDNPIPIVPEPPDSDPETHTLDFKAAALAAAEAEASTATPMPRAWAPAPSDENLLAALEAKRRGIDVDRELMQFRAWAAAQRAKCFDWDAKWRWFLPQGKPANSLIVVDAVAVKARDANAKAARDREREAEAEKQKRAEQDREDVRRATKAALESNFRLPAEKATA